MRGKKQKTERVIPGVGLSFGITITMLGLIVVIPFPEFVATITNRRVVSSYLVSF